MSIDGNCSIVSAGGVERFGPAKLIGEARSEKIGSVSILSPLTCSKKVLCPIHVICAAFGLNSNSNCG